MGKKREDDPFKRLKKLVNSHKRKLKRVPWMAKLVKTEAQDEIEFRERLGREKTNRRTKRITLEMIAKASDDEIMELFFDLTLARLEGVSDRNKVIQSLPIGMQYLWAIDEVNGEVENGGFDQYFQNTHGDLVKIAIEGFKAFEMPLCAQVVGKATKLASRLRKTKRWGRERIPELDSIDQVYYAAAQGLDNKQVLYMRKHPELFTTGG